MEKLKLKILKMSIESNLMDEKVSHVFLSCFILFFWLHKAIPIIKKIYMLVWLFRYERRTCLLFLIKVLKIAFHMNIILFFTTSKLIKVLSNIKGIFWTNKNTIYNTYIMSVSSKVLNKLGCDFQALSWRESNGISSYKRKIPL